MFFGGSRITAGLCLIAALWGAAPARGEVRAPSAPDGRVTGLNAGSYEALKNIKRRNPGSLTEKEAGELATAIRSDGELDPVEVDLLIEMTQSQFRNIRIVPADTGGTSGESVMTFPTVGKAKRVLQQVLHPVLDLATEWAKPDRGWNAIVSEYKSNPEGEARVLVFLTDEMAKMWEISNQGNGYKPLRDEIGKIYGLCHGQGADSNTGRILLYKAMNQVDRDSKDSLPDFLYNWLRPGGTL